MSTISVKLNFDRKGVASKQKKSSLFVEVCYERKRKYYATGIKLFSDQWSKKSDKVINHPNMVVINEGLINRINDIYRFINRLESEQENFTFEKLDKFLNVGNNANSSNSFLEYMEKRIYERKVSDNTKVRQKCVLKALKEWGVIRSFKDITPANIQKYDDFAKGKCNKASSVYNYHKILKTFIREAYTAQKITNNPYLGFKLNKGVTNNRKFLLKEELKAIETKEIENDSLNRVRDVFLFCCYTGLAYSDLAAFDFSKAVLSEGLYRIRDARKKTGEEYNISLMDKAMEILRKYDMKLPVISNQKYNAYLKVLGAYCDVKKCLTSHVARHTFATTIALNNGVRIEAVSKMLGHSNISTTQLYAKLSQQEVDKAFNYLNNVV